MKREEIIQMSQCSRSSVTKATELNVLSMATHCEFSTALTTLTEKERRNMNGDIKIT